MVLARFWAHYTEELVILTDDVKASGHLIKNKKQKVSCKHFSELANTSRLKNKYKGSYYMKSDKETERMSALLHMYK